MPQLRFRAALEAVLAGESLPVMHHQPIVDLRRGHTVGYEALVRFPGPLLLPPDEWFRGAEMRGKRPQLELLVARLSIASRASLPQDTFLTVNLSPNFLMSQESSRLFAEVGDLSRMVFEITEGDRVADYTAFRKKLDCVRTLGGNIAVDDTGSGYSSLKHVMELRPQFIKLDRFFVSNCHADPAKGTVIQMIGEAADRMDAWLIAEGIEQEAELFELIRHGVPLGQGYHLGHPELGMQSLDVELGRAIRSRNPVLPEDNLLHYVEPAPRFDSLLAAENEMRSTARGAFAVVIDRHARPTHLVEDHPLLGVRVVPSPMRVQIRSTLPDILRRAMSRPPSHRFDPMVTVNGYGSYEGVLRIDRLTQGMLATV